MADTGIRLIGWSDFVRDLRRTSPEIAKELRKANRGLANEFRDRSRTRARREYGKGGSYGGAARAISSRAFPDAARLRLRPASDPRVLGSEFGSKQYSQFKSWTGNQWVKAAGPQSGVGYAVFPTIREGTEDIRDTYGDRMMDAVRLAFPERF